MATERPPIDFSQYKDVTPRAPLNFAPAPATTPFESTPVGVGLNFLGGLVDPSNALKVGKDIVQGTASSFASIGNTILNTIFPNSGMDVVKVPPYLQGLYGQPEIKDLGTRVLELTKTIQDSPTAQRFGLDKQAPAIAFAGILGDSALNLLGWGGGAEEEQLIKALVKETDPGLIGSLLRQHGILPEIADRFAPELAAHTTPQEVRSTLQTIQGVQHLGDTSEALKSVEKEVHPDFRSLAEEAGKYKSAEEFVARRSYYLEDLTANEKFGLPKDPFELQKYMKKGEIGVVRENAPSVIKEGVARQKAVIDQVNTPEKLTDFYNRTTKGSATEAPVLDAKATDEIVSKASKDWEDNYAKKYLEGDTSEQLKLEQDFKTKWEPLTKPQEIQDTLPLSVGEVIANGKSFTVDHTPAVTLADVPPKEKNSFGSLIHNFFTKNKKDNVHVLDYLATPEFVLEKLGLGKEAAGLHDAQDLYRGNLRKEITRVSDWRDRVANQVKNGQVHTEQDSSRLIFQYLDGKEQTVVPEMTAEEHTVAREIRGYLKEWADRLNLPEDNRISRYITHIFDTDVTNKEFMDGIDPELAAIMQDKVAGSVYDPFLEKRLGTQGYKEDTWAALDAYVKRATRKEAYDPALEALDKASLKLDQLSYNYVKKFSHLVNMRPTDLDKLVDSFIKQSPIGGRLGERPVAYLSQKLRQGYYRGFLGLNPASALRNLSQGANTYAKLGEKYTIVGYSKLFSRLVTRNLDELYEKGILDDGLIQDKRIGVYKSVLQKLDPVIFGMFEMAERINRGAAYFGAKSKYLAEGIPEEQAVRQAKRLVRETQFAFGKVDTPVFLNQDLVKVGAQLGTYNIKQIEFISRMIKNGEWGGLIRMTAASLAFVATIGKLFGMTIEQLIPSIGLGRAPALSTLSGVATELDPNASAQEKAAAKKKIATGFIGRIPGGIQLRKSIQGVEAFNAGEDTTPTGRLRYKIPQDASTFVRVLLFGKSSLPQAQEYYDSLDTKAADKKPAARSPL